MLTLYCAPNTISVVAALALTEADLPFDRVTVDFKAAEQTRPQYHAINPKGRVPALATPRGILTETGAILDYIATLAPDAGLVPDDAFKAAKMREVMYYLASTMHPAHAHKMRGHRWATEQASFDDMRANVPRTIAECCAYLEGNVDFSPFVLGETVSLADPYLFVVANWVPGDGVDLAAYPRLAAFHAAYGTRPAVAEIRAMGLL